MAQLKSTVVQGSLRVTDTTYTTDLVVSDVTAPTIANNDYLLVADASDGNKLLKGPIFDGSTTSQALTKKGTWATFNNYSHPTGDGNLHVPATGTGNNGKVLKAGSTAGSLSWGTLGASDVGLGSVSNNANLNSTTGAKGDIIYWSAANTPAHLAIGTAGYTLQATANGPAWTQTVAVAYGGTGQTSWTQWGVLYASASTTLTNTAAGTAGYLLQGNGAAAPSWIQATNSNIVSTIVKRDSNGDFSARTITANLTGNVTGNVSGSSGSCTGNAATATEWASAQTVYVALGTASKTTTIQGGNSNAVALGIDGTLAIGHGGTGITTTDAHKVLIGPSSGNATAPTWRTIVAADLPTATTSALGIMQVGTGLGVSSGTVSVSYGTSANTALQGNASLVKLNGLTKTAASMADFYAPTSAGTNGQFLKSVGSGEPTWSALPTADTTVAGIVKLGASGGAATYEHTHSEYAKIKPFSANWSSGTSIAIADSWITDGAAVVATDLQTKNLPGVVTWTITTNNITFTCTVAASSSTIGEFHFLMIKP